MEDWIHSDKRVLDGFCIFGKDTEFEEFDLYLIVYQSGRKLTKDLRKQLKEVGWHLQRHSRTNREMWLLDKQQTNKLEQLP